MNPPPATPWQSSYCTGYLHGLRYPSLKISLSTTLAQQTVTDTTIAPLALLLQCIFPKGLLPAPQTQTNLIDLLLSLGQQYTQTIDAAVYQDPVLLPQKQGRISAHLPMQAHRLRDYKTLLDICAEALLLPTATTAEKLRTHLETSKNALLRKTFGASNTKHFIQAAIQLHCPFQIINGDLIEYGSGAYAKKMNSSFTAHTSLIASKIARDKTQTGYLLRRAGLPGSLLFPIQNEAHAQEVAKKISYPLVLKPTDQDGGVGVFPNIADETELLNILRKAHKKYNKLGLEKHIHGQDYRLVVYRGELLVVVHRQAASVMADGVRTIEALIAQENAQPQRQGQGEQTLAPLGIHEQTETILRKQGWSLSSIPAQGVCIRLEEKSNIAAGGRPQGVDLARVHPDNVALAILAVRIIGLDLAGVDLLIPDIGQSWKTTPALICEINAQPAIGHHISRHLYPKILQQEIPAPNRPHFTLIAQTPENAPNAATRYGHWASSPLLRVAGVGFVLQRQAWIGGQQLHGHFASDNAATTALLAHPDLTQLIAVLQADDILKRGLPCPDIDQLVLPEDWTDALSEHPLLRPLLQATALHRQQLIGAPSCAARIAGIQTLHHDTDWLEQLITAKS